MRSHFLTNLTQTLEFLTASHLGKEIKCVVLSRKSICGFSVIFGSVNYGGGVFIYSGSATLISFEILLRFMSKEISMAEHMNMHPLQLTLQFRPCGLFSILIIQSPHCGFLKDSLEILSKLNFTQNFYCDCGNLDNV